MKRSAAIAAVLALAECEPAPKVGDPVPVTTGQALHFSEIAQDLGASCSLSCHAGNPPLYYPQLDPDAAYVALLGAGDGASSEQASALKLRNSVSSISISVNTVARSIVLQAGLNICRCRSNPVALSIQMRASSYLSPRNA